MADNKGQKIGTFQIEDEIDIEELNDFLDKLTNLGSFITVNKWSDGEIEIYKRRNQDLEESVKDDS